MVEFDLNLDLNYPNEMKFFETMKIQKPEKLIFESRNIQQMFSMPISSNLFDLDIKSARNDITGSSIPYDNVELFPSMKHRHINQVNDDDIVNLNSPHEAILAEGEQTATNLGRFIMNSGRNVASDIGMPYENFIRDDNKKQNVKFEIKSIL